MTRARPRARPRGPRRAPASRSASAIPPFQTDVPGSRIPRGAVSAPRAAESPSASRVVASALSARCAQRLVPGSCRSAADGAAAAAAATAAAATAAAATAAAAAAAAARSPRAPSTSPEPASVRPRQPARLARLGRAPLPRRARGRGGAGSGARHVSEPAATLLRPAAPGRARPAPPARPRAAPPVVPAGGQTPARVPRAPGGGLGRGEVVLPHR